MKWYIDFPIIYIIVFAIYYFFNRTTWDEASLFVCLVMSLIFAGAVYAGIEYGIKNQKKKKK